MTKKLTSQKMSRRKFFKLGGQVALATGLTGGVFSSLAKFNPTQAAPARPPAIQLGSPPARPNADATYRRLAATDGFISLPGRRVSDDNGIYVFSFVLASPATPGSIGSVIDDIKGHAKLPAPILGFNENEDVYITLTNVGLFTRPDLDDSHTIHWHGFRNPNAVFDGVPEVSIAVPVARDFPFYFKPRDAGTYMYHCHFEDVEHVQMGMDGVVFVRPAQDGTEITTSTGTFTRFAYNDGDGSTGYHREFTFMMNDLWSVAHDNLASIQENIWSNYKADFWTLNGRCYPDTILRNGEVGEDPLLEDSQPVSCLIQINEGETGLLRLASLGYEQYSMQLPGIRMKVVGNDATPLGSLTYDTNTLYIGPGEARDVLFVAPPYDPDRAEPDPIGNTGDHNVYWFKNRNYQYLNNGGAPGLGGHITQVWVYPADTLPPQTAPNQTYLNL